MVCVGNICRSPTTERILRKLMPNKTIDSAGIAALVDKAADHQATEVAAKYGIALDGHKARQLNSEICSHYDLVLVMEKGHIDAVHQLVPEARGKVMLLGHWLNNQEVADPYRQSSEMFEHVFQLMMKAAQSWQNKLQ